MEGQGSRARRVVRFGGARSRGGGPQESGAEDVLAVEEPLEIRVAGDPLAVTMRTPGHDRELAAGFLFAEGLVGSKDDLGALVPCGPPGTSGHGNAIDASASPGVTIDVERFSASRRGAVISSACGVCGRSSIADVLARVPRLPPGPVIAPALLSRCVDGLCGTQPLFSLTGGLHGAAVFDARGALLCAFEDVGRHNAVDKCVGALLLRGVLPLDRSPPGRALILAVSGRSSFEIVQKAAMAGFGFVASVSAASSLAAELADTCNLTLAGFARDGALTVYAHPERLWEGARLADPGGEE